MRSRILITLVFALLLLPHIVHAQAGGLNQGGPATEAYYTEVPFEVVRNKLVLLIEIGDKPRRFLLDTGAPMLLSKALSDELHPEVLSVSFTSDANGNTDSLKMVKTPTWSLGEVVFEGVPALVADLGLLGTCFGIDGFIGSNALRQSIIRIDKQRNLLILTSDSAQVPGSPLHQLPLLLDRQSSPFVEVMLGKKYAHPVQVDIGADAFFDLGSPQVARFLKKKRVTLITKGFGSNSMSLFGMEAPVEKYRVKVPAFQLAGTAFSGVVTETSADEESRLGATVLDYGVITLDYRNKVFGFEPYLQDQPIVCDSTRWDVNPMALTGKLQVGTSWVDNELLKSGTEIVSMDGMPLENIDLCEVILHPLLENKTSATLGIRKTDGKVEEVRIYKR